MMGHLTSFARKAFVGKVIEIILQSYCHDYSTLLQRDQRMGLFVVNTLAW